MRAIKFLIHVCEHYNNHLSSNNIDLRAGSLLSIDLGRRGMRGRVAGGATQYRLALGTAR